MAEKKTTPVIINNVEYALEDMTVEQKTIIAHVTDLDRKIKSTKFNLDQLSVGREAFVNMLAESIEEKVEDAA